MKKIINILALLLAAATVTWAQPLRNSEIRTECVHSEILGEDVMVNVYLPVGYDQGADKLYPSAYLLHGLTDTYTSWE